jgi:uncharacterized protein
MHTLTTLCTAFAGTRRVASGSLEQVAVKAKEIIDRGESAPLLIFDDGTSQPIEVDFRGTAADVLSRLARMESTETESVPEADGPRGPGRPKLGVVAREITLLPRHWDWLNAQPGGASVALRKLVEAARRANEGKDRTRQAQEAAYRFMSAMAGNEPGFEEAARALFANDQRRFDRMTESWPVDVRSHARKLASSAFANPVAA